MNATRGVDHRTANHPAHGQAFGAVFGGLPRGFSTSGDGHVGATEVHVLGAHQITGDHVQFTPGNQRNVAFAGADGAAGQGGFLGGAVVFAAADGQVLIAGDVVQAQLIAGQHAGQVAVLFLVHVGARKGVLRRINRQVTPGLHGQVAGADQRRAGHCRILPRHHADRLARDHAAHGHGALLVDLVLDLARLQPAPAAFAFLALMPGTFGISHRDDLHILARHQFCRAFVGGHGATRQQQVFTGYQGAVAARADTAANVVDGVGLVETEFFPRGAFLGLAVEAVVLILGGPQGQILAGHQVRFIAGADVTGEQQ